MFENVALSFVYVIQCKTNSSLLSKSAKKKKISDKTYSPKYFTFILYFTVIVKYKIIILHLNKQKCQVLTMLQLNVVHVYTTKMLVFQNLLQTIEKFSEKSASRMCWILLQET